MAAKTDESIRLAQFTVPEPSARPRKKPRKVRTTPSGGVRQQAETKNPDDSQPRQGKSGRGRRRIRTDQIESCTAVECETSETNEIKESLRKLRASLASTQSEASESEGWAVEVGDHVVVKYSLYNHHGIYCGDGKVIHLSKESGTVTETTLDEFADGCSLYIQQNEGFDEPEVIVRRARSKRGEQGYCLFTNNCEHFANWCQTGRAKSRQVRDWTLKGISSIGTNVAAHGLAAVACRAAASTAAASGAVATTAAASTAAGTAAVGGGGVLASLGLSAGGAAGLGAVVGLPLMFLGVRWGLALGNALFPSK